MLRQEPLPLGDCGYSEYSAKSLICLGEGFYGSVAVEHDQVLVRLPRIKVQHSGVELVYQVY